MERDDFFTHIHKAIRLGLFETVAAAGRTDWTATTEVAALESRWRPLLELLNAHTRHENSYIFRILDPYDPIAVAGVGDEHDELDAMLGTVAALFDAAFAQPTPATGLLAYRELTRFVAEYLPHLLEEETVVMAKIWELCTDDELAATRQAFMSEVPPHIMSTTLELMLPAIERPARREMIEAMAATAPPSVFDSVLAIVDRVLEPADAEDLRGLVGRDRSAVAAV